MIKTGFRWAVPLIALFAVGPAAGWLVLALRATDGGNDVSLLLSRSPAIGVGVGLLAMALCVLVALPGARLLGLRPALFACGLAMLWPAWMTGRMGMVLRLDPGAGALARLAVEGAIVGAAGVLVVLFLARRGPDSDQPLARDVPGQVRRALTTGAGLAGTLASAAGALVVAWLVAREDLRGQALFAAILGGIGGAVAARLVGTALDQHAPLASGYVGLAVASVIAPLLGLLHPGSDLFGSLIASDTPGYLLLQPMDWVVGAFLGVPVGFSWLGEFEHAAARPHPA